MDVKSFVSSIYLGDRGVNKITFDTSAQKVSVEIDCISRIRSDDGQWHFYTDEDMENGELVFGGVTKVYWPESGRVLNGYINRFEVLEDLDGLHRFGISGDSVSDDSENVEVSIHIFARSIEIRDPKQLKS